MPNNEIMIVGMPNSGKTTLYNNLTKSNERVGNWHGVTVNLSYANFNINSKIFTLIDSPGIYSLKDNTLEEKVTLNKLSGFNGIVLFMTDYLSLPSSINIVKSLYEKGLKVILLVNFIKEFYKKGGKIDESKIKNALPFPVVFGDFISKKSVLKVKDEIFNFKQTAIKKIEDIKDFIIYPTFKESKVDTFILNKYISPFFVVFCLLFAFFMSFSKYGLGWVLSYAFNLGFDLLREHLVLIIQNSNLTEFLSGLLINGIYDGISGIVCFMPQMIILSLMITILERTGIMARIAFLSEKVLYKTGLNGRAIFSALMSFGCTAVAISLSNGLENEKTKKRAVFLSGSVSCSAKIPVFLLLASMPSVKYPLIYILCVYIIIFALLLIRLYFTNKLLIKGERVPLVMEIPPYRFPAVKDLIKSLIIEAKRFIIKITTTIFLITMATYLLTSLSFNLSYVGTSYEDSVLCFIGRLLTPLLYPLGIRDSRLTTALIAGVFAKESIAVTLVTLYGTALNLELQTLIPFTIFIIVYPPCMVAISQVLIELGKKFTLLFISVLYVEAFILSFICRQILLKPTLTIILIILIILSVGVYEKFYSRKKPKINKIST